MTETPSAAEQARARRRKRRAAKLEMRDACFEALAEGYTQEQIAKARGISVATARVTKALALLDMRISRGEMEAVGPFLKTVTALDRYHGFVAPEATFAVSTGAGLSGGTAWVSASGGAGRRARVGRAGSANRPR